MTWKKEDEEKILKAVYERMLEIEKKHVYEAGSISLEFEAEIRKLGFIFETSSQVEYICQENPEITRNVILKYYDKAILGNEKGYLVDCLISKYNKDLVPFFLREYVKKENSIQGNMVAVAIGNFLIVNADKEHVQEYINILNMPKEDMIYRKAYIITICGKLKLGEAIQTMLRLLKEEPKLTGFILDAFRKYRDVRFLPIFKQYIDDKDSYIRNIAKKGIASTEKMLNKS